MYAEEEVSDTKILLKKKKVSKNFIALHHIKICKQWMQVTLLPRSTPTEFCLSNNNVLKTFRT